MNREKLDKGNLNKKEIYTVNWKIVLRLSFVEFQRWMRSSRLIILCVMLVFVNELIILPLKECASLMGENLSVAEAFLALGNSGTIVLVVPVLYLVLMADFPQKGGIDLLYQIRCSKKVWILGQVMFVLETVLFLVVFLVVSSSLMILSYAEWRMEFSYAVTHFVSTFPERRNDYLVQLVPENLYQQMTMGAALMHTIFMMSLHFLFLALVLLLSALCNKKLFGIFIDGFLLILGAVTCGENMAIRWMFPMAHTIPWVHFEPYLRKEIFPVSGSYFYLIGCCIFLFISCMTVSGKYQVGKA